MNSLVRTKNMFHRSVCITVICLKNGGLKNTPEIFLVLLFLTAMITSKIITHHTASWEVGGGGREKYPMQDSWGNSPSIFVQYKIKFLLLGIQKRSLQPEIVRNRAHLCDLMALHPIKALVVLQW